jgi:pyruvate/2-oxoglutarate dehydrogenase complex dihydrolipoamide acyltransferase (E2) component
MLSSRVLRLFTAKFAVGRFEVCTKRLMSAYPSHTVVGMPALSPTMEAGTISKWNCKIGDKVTAGDALAEVETDKATVTFESQDDFVIAKFLVGVGAEVKVGDPILVTVDDESAVAAFSNFTAPIAAASSPAPAPMVKPKPAPVSAPAVKAEPPTPAPALAALKKVETPVTPQSVVPVVKTAAPSGAIFEWGTAVSKSPLAKALSAEQEIYNVKYGRSLQKPVKAT